MAKKKATTTAPTTSYPQPNAQSASYVFLVLALGTVKRFLASLVVLNNLEAADETTMIDFGVKVIEGTKTSDDYVKEFEKIITKYSDEKLSDLGRNQIKQRIDLSTGTLVKEPPLNKETKKPVKLKEAVLTDGKFGVFVYDLSDNIEDTEYADTYAEAMKMAKNLEGRMTDEQYVQVWKKDENGLFGDSGKPFYSSIG